MKTLLLAATLLAPTFASAADKPTHLFILSGQSNMARMKPEADFVPETKALFPDAEVAFIKVAKGGMPIRLWVPEWNEIAKRHGLDPGEADAKAPFYQSILSQMRDLRTKHPDAASITFCWMQGERDAKTKLAAAYGPAFRQLVVNLRRDLEFPAMNVVVARISDFGAADDASWQAIRRIQVEFAKEDEHAAWVDCDDLNDQSKNGRTVNDLHYTAEGYKILGQRYARQAKALITGKAPAADGRP